jgi:hypothetical protein
MGKTTVQQALDAIITYVEGATGVRYTVSFEQTDRDFASFRSRSHGGLLPWVLDIQYAPVEISPESRINPFALVMDSISLGITMHVDPITEDSLPQFDQTVREKFGPGYKASIEHIHGEPRRYLNLLTLEHQENKDYSIYVDVRFRWQHPGGGSNGKGILVWMRDGHIFRVDRRR